MLGCCDCAVMYFAGLQYANMRIQKHELPHKNLLDLLAKAAGASAPYERGAVRSGP